ncbi:PAAR domain-containing protein [Ralstonia solanacearum]|uniref:PAAR domain-containing protein n=1 Tax=Ralstonia solanacearum TaxID=305 RepID=UPI0035125BD9
MSTLLAAARLGDPVAHTASKGWMMAGLIAGALIGAAAVVVTGGAALTLVAAAAAGAAAGGGLGEVLGTMSWAPRHVTGSLISGSFNVFVNGRPAVRAHLSQGTCGDHSGSPQLVAQGSSTVFINGQPAARMEDMLTCSAVISAGSPNVFIGGTTVTTDDISPEIPGWVNWTMLAVGVAAAAVLAGPLVAALGTVGGIAGGEGGSWLGGKVFGEGSDGQKWSMLGGSLLGGFAGAKGAGMLRSGRAPEVPLGTPSRSVALLTEADPAREVMGSATVSHPAEIAQMRGALADAGVEVIDRPGSMAYSPGLREGEPGQMIIDPDASYSAWLHEYQHAMDDKAVGWGGMKSLFDGDLRWQWEQNAYNREIELAQQFGHDKVVEQLQKNMELERQSIYGER